MSEGAATFSPSADDPWDGSPYQWLRLLTSRTKGKAAEHVMQTWLQSLGIDVTRPSTTGADRTVLGLQVEVKLSTLWSTGEYRFQQLRDQDYSHVLLFGVSPDRLSVWVVPKSVVLQHAEGQHTGARSLETKWLAFPASNPPPWLEPFGGDPGRAEEALRTAAAEPPTT